jgi:tail length tape measure protein
MGVVIETLTAEIGADISGLTSGLKTAKDKLTDFGDGLQSAGKTMLAMSAPILGFLGASVKAAADSELAVAQLNTVLKSTKGAAGVTAKSATDLASALQKTTRYGDEEILSAENLLLTFTNIKKNVFPQVTKLALDMSTALGQDLKSSSIQLGKALQDPITGVTALRRVGVNFTESQMDMIKALVKSGDLLGAQKIIIKELQTEFGGSAEAAGKTFAGQLDILKNQFGEVMESVGKALIPALQQLVKEITPIVSAVADWISKNPDLVVSIGKITLAIVGAGGLLIAIGKIGGAATMLLSPIGLLIVAIGGILIWANNAFGGLDKMFSKAVTAAQQLGTIALYIVNRAAQAASQLVQMALGLINRLINDTIYNFKALQLLLSGSYNIDMQTGKVSQADLAVKRGYRGVGAVAGTGTSEFNKQNYAYNQGAIPTRDSGGGVSAGQPVMVGRGAQPELFVPSSSGRMFPAGSYGGPQMLTVVLRADSFEEHIVVNIADAMRAGAH